MTARRQRLISAFIVVLSTVLVIDALPITGSFHKRLKDTLDPMLDVTGLWQGSWQLYAPVPDRVNSRISARLLFADGTSAEWSQPDWTAMSGWQRFLHFRKMEFLDNVRMDGNKGAWSGLAAYLARIHEEERGGHPRVTKVVLTRAAARIPSPGRDTVLPATPYRRFDDKSEFFTWEAK